MIEINFQDYNLNICTEIGEWGKMFYGMPDGAELENQEKLESECMGFASIDDKVIWIFIPKNYDSYELEDTIAHEVGHIIEFKHPKNSEQTDENFELHEAKAEHYENYYNIVRSLFRLTKEKLNQN